MARLSSAGVGTRDEIDRGGGGEYATKPGKYRAKVKSIKPHMEDETPSVNMVFEVSGTGPKRDPIGSILFHRVYFKDTIAMRKQITKMYLRLGLLIEDDRGRFVDAMGEEVLDSDTLSLVGNEGEEICGEWKAEAYTGDDGIERTSLKVPYNELWLAKDPKVSGWDCNKGINEDSPSSEPIDGVDDDV